MAAEANVSIIASLTGLGKNLEFAEKFATSTTITRAMQHYAVQDTANTDQVLELGDVGTIQLLIIKCVDNDVNLDLDYDSSAFDADLQIQEGECAVIPTPSGIVRFRNVTTDEVSTIEYLLLGT